MTTLYVVESRLRGVRLAPGKRDEANLSADGWSCVADYRDKDRAIHAADNLSRTQQHCEVRWRETTT